MTLKVLAALAIGAAGCARANVPVPQPEAAARTPDVVFVPTPFPVVDRMLAVAKVGRGDVLYDLGSGDGRIVIAAAKRFGIRAVGIDIDPKRIEESNHNADTARVRSLVDFRIADLFTTDLRSASVVTLYLLPTLNARLRPKLFEELRPGSRVVSHSFDMGDWKADSTLMIDARIVYYWVMPADISGTWEIVRGLTTNEISFAQKYQKIVTATAGGNVYVEGARVRGDSVFFALRSPTGNPERAEFRGKVSGDAMSGSFAAGSINGTWRATRPKKD